MAVACGWSWYRWAMMSLESCGTKVEDPVRAETVSPGIPEHFRTRYFGRVK